MDKIPRYGMSTYHGGDRPDNGILYFHWQGNSLIVDSPHSHDFFMLLLTKSGSGKHIIDFTEHAVNGWTLHYLFPDQVHHWQLAADTTAYQIMISRHNFEIISASLRFNIAAYKRHPLIGLTEHEFTMLRYEFKDIDAEINMKPLMMETICSRIRIIMQKASRIAEKQYGDLSLYNSSRVLFAYLHMIDIHFREEKTVEYYATRLHITPNYLGILCRKHLNQSAIAVIRSRVLLEAKRQLCLPKLTIKEIMYDLGFNDLSNFSSYFKSGTGQSPKAFRQNILY